jgi:peptide/nickel transport system substrate-binding protein
MTAQPGGFNRRQLIIGAGAAAVAVGVAACGDDDEKASDTTASGGTETTAPAGGDTTEPAPAKSGGILRVGTLGAANDLLDGQHIVSKADIIRQATGWEPLMSFSPDYVPEYTHGLAQSVVANAADNYTITLKEGLKFSDGKPVTADDVIYSLTRVLDEESALFGGSALRPILKPEGLTKVDDLTVDVQLLQGVSIFPEFLCAYTLCVVPVGYERFDGDPTTQIGTGPYMLTEFEPGNRSVHVKNPNYWDTANPPSFDEVHIIDFADADAMINALLSDQIDAAQDLPASAVETVGGTDGYSVLNAAGGGWKSIVMAVDQEPFTDVRVRQAFRLIVDREAMVEQVLAGYGTVANDLFAPLDGCYIGDELPQRVQDIEQAKALLAEAGQSDLTIDFFAPDDTAGLPELVQLFAEQAKAAGITVNPVVLPGSEYWGDEYLKRTFATDYWGTRNFLPQVAAGSLPTAPYPGDHWPPAGSTFITDYETALAETDPDARCEIMKKMQTELYETGGLIIPYFENTIDGYNSKLQGLVERPNTLNLDHYGRGFKMLSFTE